MSNIKKTLNLGLKIKRARQNAGLSQKDLAKKAGVSDKAVSAYETGRSQPSFEMIKLIGDITSRSLEYFSGGDEAPVSLDSKIELIEKELKEIREALRLGKG